MVETFGKHNKKTKQSFKDIHFIFDVLWVDGRLENHDIANGGLEFRGF